MGRGRGWNWCAAAGACSLGAGTVAFALFSPSTSGCTTNLVVLADGAVTTRSCAAYSVAAHLGVGLMVLGGVLLFGFFLVAAVRPQAEPSEDTPSVERPHEPPAQDRVAPPPALPPGWYGNPGNPAKPVQWWDGTRLTDAPPRPGE